MRMDLWVGTYLNWKCNSEGERMSFSRRKEAHLSSALFDPNAFTPKADHIIIARPLFNVKENHYGNEDTSGRVESLN